MVGLFNLRTERPLRVMLVGDLMLDTYTIGHVRRISPEAPVTVLHVEKEEQRPGGASNVILNMISLGIEVLAVGRVGADLAGRALVEALEQEGVVTKGICIQHGYITPVKERLIARQQQMMRVDRENALPLDEATLEALVSVIKEQISAVSVVAISDYAKGLCHPKLMQALIEGAKAADIPVLIDPKGKDFSKYYGASLIKPNLSEAMQFAERDNEELEEVAKRILHLTAAEVLMVTRADEGISLFSRDKGHEHFPVKVREVKDVTGAGDTVLAALTFAKAHNLSYQEACVIANIAAGRAVEQLGCARVSLSEIMQGFLKEHLAHKVYDTHHLKMLQSALGSKPFTLLIVSSPATFSAELFRATRKLAHEKTAAFGVFLPSNADGELEEMLASLTEVDFILKNPGDVIQLCEGTTPKQLYLLKDQRLSRVENYKEYI